MDKHKYNSAARGRRDNPGIFDAGPTLGEILKGVESYKKKTPIEVAKRARLDAASREHKSTPCKRGHSTHEQQADEGSQTLDMRTGEDLEKVITRLSAKVIQEYMQQQQSEGIRSSNPPAAAMADEAVTPHGAATLNNDDAATTANTSEPSDSHRSTPSMTGIELDKPESSTPKEVRYPSWAQQNPELMLPDLGELLQTKVCPTADLRAWDTFKGILYLLEQARAGEHVLAAMSTSGHAKLLILNLTRAAEIIYGFKVVDGNDHIYEYIDSKAKRPAKYMEAAKTWLNAGEVLSGGCFAKFVRICLLHRDPGTWPSDDRDFTIRKELDEARATAKGIELAIHKSDMIRLRMQERSQKGLETPTDSSLAPLTSSSGHTGHSMDKERTVKRTKLDEDADSGVILAEIMRKERKHAKKQKRLQDRYNARKTLEASQRAVRKTNLLDNDDDDADLMLY